MGVLPPPPLGNFADKSYLVENLKAESFKKSLHSVRWGVSLKEPVTYVTLSN